MSGGPRGTPRCSYAGAENAPPCGEELLPRHGRWWCPRHGWEADSEDQASAPIVASAPLDLRAVLALLDVPVTAETEYQHFLKVADALKETVAHARALRAALEPFARWAESCSPDDPPGMLLGSRVNRDGSVNTVGDLRRAAAVLAAAQDGPA